MNPCFYAIKGILRTTQEAKSSDVPPRVSSRSNGLRWLALPKNNTWWAGDSTRFFKFLRPRRDVLLLPHSSSRTKLSKVHLVEEIHDLDATGEFSLKLIIPIPRKKKRSLIKSDIISTA